MFSQQRVTSNKKKEKEKHLNGAKHYYGLQFTVYNYHMNKKARTRIILLLCMHLMRSYLSGLYEYIQHSLLISHAWKFNSVFRSDLRIQNGFHVQLQLLLLWLIIYSKINVKLIKI